MTNGGRGAFCREDATSRNSANTRKHGRCVCTPAMNMTLTTTTPIMTASKTGCTAREYSGSRNEPCVQPRIHCRQRAHAHHRANATARHCGVEVGRWAHLWRRQRLWFRTTVQRHLPARQIVLYCAILRAHAARVRTCSGAIAFGRWTLRTARSLSSSSAPGKKGSPLPHLRRDWTHPGHICAGTARTCWNVSTITDVKQLSPCQRRRHTRQTSGRRIAPVFARRKCALTLAPNCARVRLRRACVRACKHECASTQRG
jgi:hypothetical protein